MVETETETPEIASEESVVAARITRSSRLKYYIHDGIDACRFQLLGELTETDVAELSGCWRTAKITLGRRKLILDLRALRTLDEAGTKWIKSMAAEGAVYVPLELFQDGVYVPAASSYAAPAQNTGKPSPFRALAGIFRGLRASSEESSTQAQ
jgi:hypothetical protein